MSARSSALIPRSLATRLLLGSAVATLVALALVLALMHQALTRFVTGQIDQRLDNKIVALASQTRVAADGTLSLDGEADGPPFDRRRHNAFWIIEGPRDILRTRWLNAADFEAPSPVVIDQAFAQPAPPSPGLDDPRSHPRTIRGEGLGGIALHERIARLTVGGTNVTIVVAAPVESISRPVTDAMTGVGFGTTVLGIALGALAFLQVRIGLRPLAALRAQVAEVREGRRKSLSTDQPREIAPLVFEVNRLLERNAANLEKARRHVANLAHGLKTPLATLHLGVSRLEAPERDMLRPLLDDVDLRVRHHLGRARAAALAGPEHARTMLAPHLGDIAEALARIHADRNIALATDVPNDLAVACEAHDLDEILGNLLDNAFKFARSAVTCTAQRAGARAVVEITDDGPGLDQDEVALVLSPGRRLDEQVPGFGFGLTIARELVELYGGELRLRPGDGGLSVRVALPLSGAGS